MDKLVKRRDFLKIVGAGGLYLISNKFFSTPLTKVLSTNVKTDEQNENNSINYGMITNIGACIGCRQCTYACNEENNIPNSPIPMSWIEIFEMDENESFTDLHSVPKNESKTNYNESPNPGKWYLPVACLHCQDPPCVKVCPVGATFKSQDGIIEIDYNKCIGCRQCMAACPYNARRFNWGKPNSSTNQINPQVPVRPSGVVEKCTFCQHRVREGRSPKCVDVCPVGARFFGDLNNPDSKVSRLRRANITNILLPEMNTKPNLLYILEGKKWVQES